MALPGALEVLDAVVRAHGAHMLIGAGTVVDFENVSRQPVGCAIHCHYGIHSAGDRDRTRLRRGSLCRRYDSDRITASSSFPARSREAVSMLRSRRTSVHKDSARTVSQGGSNCLRRVTLENCAAYFQAGVCAIGVGGEIADTESMGKGNHRIFLERARRFRKAITDAQARSGDGSA